MSEVGEHEMQNWGRLLLDGLPFADVLGATQRPADVNWFDYWMGLADDYEGLGTTALEDGNSLSAGYYLWVGSMCAQYAQFLWFDENRSKGQVRKADLYKRAAPQLNPPAERFDLDFDGITISGYRRFPPARVSTHPCVVLLGGLESTKEESLLFENLLLERGMATYTFDGPGQGEMYVDVAISDDFHRYTSRVVDEVEADVRIDPTRIGVLGRSLGGYYALESASHDDRFVCCASWGGFVDVDSWDLETPLTKQSWQYATKTSSPEEARIEVQRCIDARSVLHQLKCPTMFHHGALDEVPLSHLETVREHISNAPLTVIVEPDGDHCCHNLGPRPRLVLADWLASHLKPTPP